MGRPKGSKNKPKVEVSTPTTTFTNTSSQIHNVEKHQPTALEMQNWYEKNKKNIENFAEASEAVKKLKDATKDTKFRTISKINKEKLLSWLQNPSSNEKNLRDLSQYLYYRSHLYYRIIKYHANMLECDINSIIPNHDLIKDNDSEKIKKSYQQTLDIVDRMNLQGNFIRVASICLRDDVFFGCKYFESKKGKMFLLNLPADYCKINGFYEGGDLAFSFNTDYLKKYPELVELWGEPFDSMMKNAESENQKWQQMPDEYAACFKFRYEDLDLVIPPFSGLMNSLLSLLSLEDIQDVLDEQQIYKLLVATIPTISGTSDVDDFAIDPSTAISYYNKMVDTLPPYLGAVLSPIPIEQISFEDNATSDINRLEKSTEAVLNTAGGAQILNSAKITGTTAINAALRSDSEFAISTIYPQLESWVNRQLSYEMSNPCKFKLMNVTTYTKAEFRKEILEDNQYGAAPKLLLNSMRGFSAKDTLALNYLENDILNLSEEFKPLMNSHVMSGSDISNTGGAPTKDETTGELTDNGEASRDKRETSNG